MRKNKIWLGLIANGLKISSSLLIYPLYFKFLSTNELALLLLFIMANNILYWLDLDFAQVLNRYLSYIQGDIHNNTPNQHFRHLNLDNQTLFNKLVNFASFYYKLLSIIGFILLGGGFLIYLYFFCRTHDLNFEDSAIYWLIFMGSYLIALYYTYLNPVLQSLGQINLINKLQLFFKITSVLLQAIGLFLGYGLYAVILANVGIILLERLSFRYLISRHEIKKAKLTLTEFKHFLRILWQQNINYISSALGLILIGNLSLYFSGLVIHNTPTLNAFLFTSQLLTTASWISQTPMTNFFSDMCFYLQHQKNKSIQLFLQTNAQTLYLLLAACLTIILAGNWLVYIFNINKHLITNDYLILLCIVYILEKHLSNHSIFLTINNTGKMFKSLLISSILYCCLLFIAVKMQLPDLCCIILPQLLCQSLFNYWYWIKYNLNYNEISYQKYTYSFIDFWITLLGGVKKFINTKRS